VILNEETPVIPLYYDEVLLFSHKNIKGLSRNALNLLQLKRIKID
jgi:peptide/nickel transport system substrate-binding protein